MKKLILFAVIAITFASCNVVQNIQSKSSVLTSKLPNGDTHYDLVVDSLYSTAKFPKQVKELQGCFDVTGAKFYGNVTVDSTVTPENVFQYIIKAAKQGLKDLKRK